MTGDTNSAFDAASPVEVGYLTDDFGIIFPSDHGFTIKSQTGGVCCHQLRYSGVFLPLRRPKMNRGYPEWMPETDGGVPRGEKHPVTEVDLTTVPEEDYESLPEWVQERGHFYEWNEFSYWMDEHAWWYLWTDLIDDLKRWNYCHDGSMSHARDMTRVWDNVDEIWEAIDDCLNFTYEDEEYDYHEEKMEALQNDEEFEPPIDEDYPSPCEGIKWITLTGSKRDRNGDPLAPWAEDLAGETVILSYPNSD